MITVTVDDNRIRAALLRLHHAAGDISPALREIREALVESTKARFETGTGPDGNDWTKNKDSTSKRKGSSRPLLASGTLMNQIDGRLVGNDALAVYSTMEYAAMMQFGGTKAEFPQLWGDIPARPFLGISNDDETEILKIIHQHLESAI